MLLRFLSAQKSQLQRTDGAAATGIVIDKVVGDVENNADGEEAVEGSVMDMDATAIDTATRGGTVAPAEDTTADCLSWFTQYNAHRVAQRLASLGACETDALEAGNAVQNYSLARTTRQRVRKFLRDRDLKWASESASAEEPSYELSNLQAEAEWRGDRYEIDEVITYLVEAGLTGRDIAAIFTHSPSVSMMKARRGDGSHGETLEDTMNRSYFGVLCSTINLRKYDARKVLRTCPGLLTKRGSISSEEVVSILCNLGVSPTSLGRDKAALPMLLSRSPASLFRFVAFLSSDYVRMPVSKIGPFIRRSECASVLDLVAPLPRYNTNLLDGVNDGLGLGDGDIDVMPIQKLLRDGSNNMENEITKRYNAMFKTAEFLRKEVGIEDLGKVLAAYPQIFTVDRNNIIEIVNFLQDELGMYFDDVAKVIEAYPKLLEIDVAQMQSVIDYLLSLEVSKDVLGSMFRAFPALLAQDVDTSMKEVVKFLEDIGVTNIGRFIT